MCERDEVTGERVPASAMACGDGIRVSVAAACLSVGVRLAWFHHQSCCDDARRNLLKGPKNAVRLAYRRLSTSLSSPWDARSQREPALVSVGLTSIPHTSTPACSDRVMCAAAGNTTGNEHGRCAPFGYLPIMLSP